ncbi:MAG TPA: PQQ-binding-like beta-propeller repeat protein [Candidatus Paceibacterota bacterium]|nr:PQQ-binding-like beta-propeller repeat protein [Verrucomicrobiota bacterium]HOX01271.1 PQQ-binding-like beta-propeller repeat protein [Verrucomicrobiota bacterium]HRZ91468.1 PQQ-binding-like beta-propeller repeat protein [Candidatus Paceibacterota bacterium]
MMHALNRLVVGGDRANGMGLMLGALWIAGGLSLEADWPEFRGPRGDGHAAVSAGGRPAGLPLTWSETSNVRWKTPIPHRGWSTPVVMGGQVWVTTATEDGRDYFAIGLDAGTGRIVFQEKVFHSDDPEPLGNGASMNCYATPSPVIEPGRVYVHFGRFGTACLDTRTGQPIWKRDDIQCRHYRGPSSSLVLFENRLILTMDGVDVQYHIALDKRTGETLWKTDRSVAWNDENVPGQMARDGDLRKAHSTPLVVDVGGQPQMLSVGAKAAYGYDPRSGRELWRVQHPDWSAAPRPLFHRGLAFFVTGLSKKEMWAVKTDGQGDVTDTGIVWKLRTRVGKYASPILVDSLIYTAAEESFLTCLEAATGETVWTERIGGKYAASPVCADGRLYFFSQEGKTVVIEPGRAFKVLATNSLEDGFMASPAVDGSAFYLRTRSCLYRIESIAAAPRS